MQNGTLFGEKIAIKFETQFDLFVLYANLFIKLPQCVFFIVVTRDVAWENTQAATNDSCKQYYRSY